jgi:hypothetical protein
MVQYDMLPVGIRVKVGMVRYHTDHSYARYGKNETYSRTYCIMIVPQAEREMFLIGDASWIFSRFPDLFSEIDLLINSL